MYPYIRCPTCGCLLGHLFELFKNMRAMVQEQNNGTMLEVFDILGIESICCRTRISAICEFHPFVYRE